MTPLLLTFMGAIVGGLIGYIIAEVYKYQKHRYDVINTSKLREEKFDVALNYAQHNLKAYGELIDEIQKTNQFFLNNANEYNAIEIMNGIAYLQEHIYPILSEYSKNLHLYYMQGGYLQVTTLSDIEEVVYKMKNSGDVMLFDHNPESLFKEKNDNANTN